MYYSVEARERAACLYSALLMISGPALRCWDRGACSFVWEWGGWRDRHVSEQRWIGDGRGMACMVRYGGEEEEEAKE